MIAARRREREYFANSSEYRHLSNRMGSEYLGKVLSKVINFDAINVGMTILWFPAVTKFVLFVVRLY